MHLSAEAITKSVWLCVAAVVACLSIVPPQPAPSDELRKKYDNPITVSDSESRSAGHLTRSPISPRFDYETVAMTFVLSYLPYIYSALVVFMATLDTFHTLDLFPQAMPIAHTTAARRFNRQLLVGLVFATFSSTLRLLAFQTLGRFFTFQLAILPKHKLITHGLYSYARHPSYTAVIFGNAGLVLTFTAPGGVLNDYLGANSAMRLMVAQVLSLGGVAYMLTCRAEIEDRVLREEFGKEWEEWARVVRYKFVPGVL